MPIEAFFIIEGAPPSPVFAAVAGTAAGAVEDRDFRLELVHRSNIASMNDPTDALKILSANWEGKEAHKAVAGDLAAITTFEESYPPRFIIATGAGKAVLGNGSWWRKHVSGLPEPPLTLNVNSPNAGLQLWARDQHSS
ncbi:MAG: hypothetical protein M3447_00325 [Acidobacteriota bacterium]|nr:hypothetical protein [Acidobacteriota bacterium]